MLDRNCPLKTPFQITTYHHLCIQKTMTRYFEPNKQKSGIQTPAHDEKNLLNNHHAQMQFIHDLLKGVETSSKIQGNNITTEAVVKNLLERRSCNNCRRMHKRCSKNLPSCDRCERRGIKCTYTKKKKKGRPRSWVCPTAKGLIFLHLQLTNIRGYNQD